MSSRMEATAGWIRSASSHEQNRGSEVMKGVLRARRSGACEFSRNSNSLPSCKNGLVSNEKAMATSDL